MALKRAIEFDYVVIDGTVYRPEQDPYSDEVRYIECGEFQQEVNA